MDGLLPLWRKWIQNRTGQIAAAVATGALWVVFGAFLISLTSESFGSELAFLLIGAVIAVLALAPVLQAHNKQLAVGLVVSAVIVLILLRSFAPLAAYRVLLVTVLLAV